jgi:high-affinity Fe2+/Pb2+ permease
MQELFPVVSGIIAAVLTRQMIEPRARIAALVAASLVVGFLASMLSGELVISWGFIWVDALIVLAAAGVTAVAMTAWTRQTTLARQQ